MEAHQQFRFKIWAYVIMANHVHILIWPLDAKYDISKIDSGIKGISSKRYAKYLFETDAIKYGKFMVKNDSGQGFRFWQHGGGYDRNLWNAKSIKYAIKYIEANPVRKGLASCPEEYRWSSAWARKMNQGLVPDTYAMPVMMLDPQK